MKKLFIIAVLCCLSNNAFANEGCENYYSNINGKSYTTTITKYNGYYRVNTYQSIDLSTIQALADAWRAYKAKKQAEREQNKDGE